MASIFPVVDSKRCTGCGLCEKDCPSANFRLENSKAVISGEGCFACGHCMAVCPAAAVTVPILSDTRHWFKTFSLDSSWLPWGETNVNGLVRLMMSRRSCRHYTDQPVDHEQILDLIKIATTAPSGRNVQPWAFTVIVSREEMVRFGQKIAGFYEHLNRVSEKVWLRTLLKWCGKPQLAMYYEQYHDRIAQGIKEWKQDGRDRIFHHAPAGIVVSCRQDAPCPSEDALLATQNLLLGAHAMGLGTCLIGFAVTAIRQKPSLRQILAIPGDEIVYSFIALGHPAINYHSCPGRKPITIRHFKG